MNKCNAPQHAESKLLCSKCGEVICSECAVQTPVGYRCRECAKLDKLPTFRVGTKQYVIASLVGLVLAIAFGLLWSYIVPFMPFNYINLAIAPGIGAAIGELISLAVNRKRGLGLAIIAGGSMLICYLIEILFPMLRFYYFDLVGIVLSVLAAAGMLR